MALTQMNWLIWLQSSNLTSHHLTMRTQLTSCCSDRDTTDSWLRSRSFSIREERSWHAWTHIRVQSTSSFQTPTCWRSMIQESTKSIRSETKELSQLWWKSRSLRCRGHPLCVHSPCWLLTIIRTSYSLLQRTSWLCTTLPRAMKICSVCHQRENTSTLASYSLTTRAHSAI